MTTSDPNYGQDKLVALETREAGADDRQVSPSAARNRDVILETLRPVIPEGARVLEIASGTGEHAVHFARGLGVSAWWPSDLDPLARRSIAAWTRAEGLEEIIRPPVELDAAEPVWPVEADGPFDAVLNINMIHISPWTAGQGVIAGAGRVLAPGGALVFYGPFKRDGAHTAPSNAAFDESLRSRNPDWGVRDLADLETEGRTAGLVMRDVVAMPANNFTVVLRRA